MSTTGQRIKKARRMRDLSQGDLVERLRTETGKGTQGLISQIENDINSETVLLPAIARILNVSITWLDTGTGEMLLNTANTEKMPNLGKVPLIDWVAAGDFSGLNDPYPVGMAEDWLYCPSRHGSKTFALRVRGESMYNPSGSPSFKDGDIIFIDPDRAPNHKSLVICRMDDAKETTFKRLLIEGDTKMLEALNPSWPERIIKVNGNATICGVVIGRYDVF